MEDEKPIGIIGIRHHQSGSVPVGWWDAVKLGAWSVYSSSSLILDFLGSIFEDRRYKELGGPIRIAIMADDTADMGLRYFLQLPRPPQRQPRGPQPPAHPRPRRRPPHLPHPRGDPAAPALGAPEGAGPAGRPGHHPLHHGHGHLQRPQPVRPATTSWTSSSSTRGAGRVRSAGADPVRPPGGGAPGLRPLRGDPGRSPGRRRSSTPAGWPSASPDSMSWLARNLEGRADPRQRVPGARSVICLGMHYDPSRGRGGARSRCPAGPGGAWRATPGATTTTT